MPSLFRNAPGRGRQIPLLFSLILLALAASGCNWMGWTAQTLTGDGKQRSQVTAEYRGMENKSVAVIVAASEYTLFEHPGAPVAISRAVSHQLATDIKGVKLTDPQQIAKFQYDNPYWITMTNGQLLQNLKVDRIIYIDLTQFSTHEPGNTYVWRGVVVANVSVAEANAKNPDNFTYQRLVNVQFPEDRPVGLLNSDDQTVQLGTLRLFGAAVSNLFHDHEEVKIIK